MALPISGGVKARIRTAALLATCAIVVLGAVAPAADARRVARKSATAVLPGVSPYGKLRPRERVVSVSAQAGPDAELEVFLQAFCFDRLLQVHRTQRTFNGTGQVRGTVRKPRGYTDCSASASVRVTSRPLTSSGQQPGPTRLGVALYARR